jgi:carbamoyl-phosphate synthase small subunit
MLREHGVMRGIISPHETVVFAKSNIPFQVPLVSCRKPIIYTPKGPIKKRIVLVDCGVKHGILRALLSVGYQITRIPWDENPLDFGPMDGVFVSNGPGDPKDCVATIENIKKVLDKEIPYLGVCLGNQLLALAIGADTYKLPYGHRGLNQPCMDLDTKKSYITSQNHGYAVSPNTIPKGFLPWFTNLNDGTNEGLRHVQRNIHSVQFHPEGSPGPFDTKWIFGLL